MLAITMIIGAVFLRLIPHAPNFAPITALGLFGGRYINKKFAIFVPLIAMVLSDYLLLYISPFEMKADVSRIYPVTALFRPDTLFVWSSFIVSGLIGMWLRNHGKPNFVIGATFVASIQFFIITNFGVWATGAYSRGLDGLITSYIMGLPFLTWTFLGDLFYTGVFFGAYEIVLKIAHDTRRKTTAFS